MKKYEKPRMIAFSLGGSEILCGDCTVKLQLTDAETQADIMEALGRTDLLNDGLTKQEVIGLFSAADDTENVNACANDVNGGFESYCKFTGANVISWS